MDKHAAIASTDTLRDGGMWRGAFGLAAVALAGFGWLYSMAGVGLGQVLFPAQANGSLVMRDGLVVGSALVAQPFAGESWFLPRPSAAGYDPMAMAGSNQARTNPDLRARVAQERESVARREGVAPEQVPSDLVTQSGAGIDPHISVQAARIQVERVAKARNMTPETVHALLDQYIEGPQLAVLGQARVNVLALNLALAQQARP